MTNDSLSTNAVVATIQFNTFFIQNLYSFSRHIQKLNGVNKITIINKNNLNSCTHILFHKNSSKE